MYPAEMSGSVSPLRSWSVDREEAAEARAEATDAMKKAIGYLMIFCPVFGLGAWAIGLTWKDVLFAVAVVAAVLVWIVMAHILIEYEDWK